MDWVAIIISIASLVVAIGALLLRQKEYNLRANEAAGAAVERDAAAAERERAAAARLPSLQIVPGSINGQGRTSTGEPQFSVDVRALRVGSDAGRVQVEVSYGGQPARRADQAQAILSGETRTFLFTTPAAWADAERRLDHLMPTAKIRAVDLDSGAETEHEVPWP